MSTRDRRARKRCAKLKSQREEVHHLIIAARENCDDAQRLWETLLRIAASPLRVWEVVRDLDLDDMEHAMVAQAVAPHLAAMGRHRLESRPASEKRSVNDKGDAMRGCCG